MKKELAQSITASLVVDDPEVWLEAQLDEVQRISQEVEDEYRTRLRNANPLRRMYLRRQMEQVVMTRVSELRLPVSLCG
tara:strand:+ start:1528 stop:1764 length:237 start_codon:yes stop_codon:yes gene_type:complete